MTAVNVALIAAIETQVEASQSPQGRTHLGGSVVGKKCARAIWYGWRWAHIVKHTGRLLRLFKRGELEEYRVVEYLKSIGLEVTKTGHGTGNQQSFADFGGHFGGSGDGEIAGMAGLYPDVQLFQLGSGLLECKTHGEKSFIDLAGKLEDYRKYLRGTGPFTGKGVLSSKPEHYNQMQVYMHYFRLPWALYVATNKNTDDLYFEIISYRPEIATYLVEKAQYIVYARQAPPRISNDASWWECKFCDFREICHYGKVPQKNCRSCVFSGVDGSGWRCDYYHQSLPPEFMPKGCDNWSPIQ